MFNVVQDRTEYDKQHGCQTYDQDDFLPSLSYETYYKKHFFEVPEELYNSNNTNHPEQFSQANQEG